MPLIELHTTSGTVIRGKTDLDKAAWIRQATSLVQTSAGIVVTDATVRNFDDWGFDLGNVKGIVLPWANIEFVAYTTEDNFDPPKPEPKKRIPHAVPAAPTSRLREGLPVTDW